jgi:uroporphyrinogen-III synthase
MTKTTILNTRPEFSSQLTAQIFEDNGFAVINFPCIEITATENRDEITSKLSQVSVKDTVIFTSQHAVTFAYQLHPTLRLTKQNTIIAVGTKTAELLEQHCNADIWVPEKQNSQGVIELLQNLKDIKSIKLISAANGREEIQNYAIKKSINLKQINVYQRQLPLVNTTVFNQIEQTNQIITLATSITTIKNLKQLIPSATWQHLQNQRIACASQRIAQEAKKQNFRNTINTQSANSAEIAQFLTKN